MPIGAGIGMQPYFPVLADGFNCIAYQVGKHLPHLSGQAYELFLEVHLFLDLDCSRLDLSLIQRNHVVENIPDLGLYQRRDVHAFRHLLQDDGHVRL